jgi:hypothetical protein
MRGTPHQVRVLILDGQLCEVVTGSSQLKQSGRKNTPVLSAKRIVWRITSAAPQGEYVDSALSTVPPPDAPELPAAVQEEPAERAERSWLLSSFELAHGLDVIEDDPTIPAELFDEFDKPPRR